MLKFYEVDENYVKYLQRIDNQIPNISYDSHNKFTLGIVLKVGDIDYYAPISSFNQIQKTNLPIYDKRGNVISTIRFCFMFPVPSFLVKEMSFAEVDKVDSHYADLLKTEYDYCINNENTIMQKAKSVYSIGCNKNHRFNYTCCDFKALETAYTTYLNTIKESHGQVAPTTESK